MLTHPPRIQRIWAMSLNCATLGLCATTAHGQIFPIPAFKIEAPRWYIQVGLVVNPALGEYPFIIPPPAFWDSNVPPTRFAYNGASVRHVGAAQHLIPLHAGEGIGPRWDFDINRALPAPGWWQVETRVRRTLPHGPHLDYHVAVVGAQSGTAPGPSVGPRLVMLGGSAGVHPFPFGTGLGAIRTGGAQLNPPSGLPSPVEQDYPGAQLLSILELDALNITNMTTLAIIVSGIESNVITNVWVRNGQNGPILIDLLPQLQLHGLGQYEFLLTLQDGILPNIVAQTITAGNAYVSVRFPPHVHPDLEIGGYIKEIKKAGDVNNDGVVNVGDLLSVINAWGPCPAPCPPSCIADVNEDCIVNVGDLLAVINNWG